MPLTRWRVVIRPLDETDAWDTIELSSDEAYVFPVHESGVVIQTRPTGFGDFYDERVVPWAQVADYRKTTDLAEVGQS